MRYIVGSAVTVAVFALAFSAGAQQVSKLSEPKNIDAEVVMKDKAFHVTQGESGKGIALVSGTRADIRLRNEDSVAHEFVSTMLYNVPFQLNGAGTLVKAPKAQAFVLTRDRRWCSPSTFQHTRRSSNIPTRSSGATSMESSAETRCAERF